MAIDHHDTDAFRDARFTHVDLSGAVFRDCDLSRVKIVDSALVEVSLSGDLTNVRVNDVDVTGFVESELDRRFPERIQVRTVRTADDYRGAWDTLERCWVRTISRAERLPEPKRHESVDDEWSLVQTLRHLVFATDAWALRAVLDEDAPYHRIGLPGTGYPREQARAIGLDPAADPSWTEVLRVRADRQDRIRELLGRIDEEELGRTTRLLPAPGYPTEDRTVGRCLRVVINEECEHRRYAERDLDELEARVDG